MKKNRTYTIKAETFARVGLMGIIILLLQFQSFAAPRVCSDNDNQLEISAKEYNVVSTPLPSLTKIEIAEPEFPFIEEIIFSFENNDTPLVDNSIILKRYFFDLFRVITPSNAP